MARVLVIDDSPDLLLLVQFALESAGHEVLTSTEPTLEDAETVDLVVLDVMLPKRSGLDVLAELRQSPATRSCPVILISALDHVDDKLEGFRAGADDYLTKPFEMEELVVRVARLLERKPNIVTSVLQGRFQADQLAGWLQTFEMERRTGVLTLESEAEQGEIGLNGGQIDSASVGRLRGFDALLALLEWHDSAFRFDDRIRPAAGLSPSLQIQNVLLAHSALADELSRRRHSLPEPEQPLMATTVVEDVPDELDSAPVRAVLDRFAGGASLSLQQLQESMEYAPMRIQLVIAWALEVGMLRPADQGAQILDLPVDDERLDGLLRDFLQEAVFRGIKLDDVEILFLAPPARIEVPWRLLASLSPEPLDLSVLAAQQASRIRLSADGVSLHVSVSQGAIDPLRPPVAVVVWAGDEGRWLDRVLDALPDSFAGTVGLALGPGDVPARPNWRSSQANPASLGELFGELLDAVAHAPV